MSGSSPAPAGSGAIPNLQLSPQERLAFAHCFSLADPSNSGLVQGHAAVPFFAKSKLSPPVLGQIWSLADSTNNGFLTAPTFSIALRLIGHAQRGETPDQALIQKPGAPPVLEGIQLPQLPPSGSAMPMSPQSTGMGAGNSIKPEDRSRYTRIFAGAGPSNGLLDGEKAKEIFVKSQLPFDKLGSIWNLADTKARGALDLTDFIIGMHFIQSTMNGSISTIPATLPPGLYENAAGGGGPGSPLRAQATGGSAALPRQLTGQQTGGGGFSPMPLSPSNTGMRSASGQQPSFMAAQRTGGAGSNAFGAPSRGQSMSTAPKWAVTADEKAKADRFFDGLDTERTGSLDGGSVVPFFMQSKLSEQTLALVWDLSDITQSGSLTREEFAVAMHLINLALTGSEIPQELPADLIPPSLRGQDLPDAVNPQQTDTQKDLFSLMDDDDVQSQQLPVNTASAFAAPVSGAPVVPGTTTSQPQPSTTRSAVDSSFDDDFFGGGSTTSSRQVGSPAAPTRSAVPSSQLPTDQSADYGNKSIQLNSTQKAVDDLQSKRSNLESGVSQNTSSLAELETRLTTVRSTHDTESRLVKELEARRDKQAVELKELRDGLISAESELSRLKGEKDEIEQQVMHDREEVRETKKKMGDVQTALTALKAEVEKLRKEGRQQKGMVAIAKKQLSTAETEHDKTSSEKTQLEQQPAQVAEEEQEAPFATSAAPSTERSAPAVPGGFESVVSPGGSVRSNNPFDRFKGSSSPAVASPIEQSREQQQQPGEQSSGLGAVAAGAAAGIAAATAGVGAMLLGESHEDKATSEQQAAPASRAMEDPWATSSGPAAATSNRPSADGFDDTFGDDFAPTSNTVSQGLSSHNAAFDDAFSGFDDAPSQQQQQSQQVSREGTTPFEPPTHPSEPAHVEDSTDTRGTAVSDLPTAAPTADQVATDDDVFPVNADETPAVASTLDKGKTPIRGDQDDDSSSSSDEDDGDDEGPEDLENPRYGSGAAAASGLSRSDSPDEVGYGKTPEQDVPTSDPSTVSGVAATDLPPAETAAVASQRFPELPTDDEIAKQAANAGHDVSTRAGADPFPTSTDQPSYNGAGSRGLAVPSSGSFGGPGAISSQATGASDAFFDAPTDGLPSSTSGGFGTTSGLAGLTAGGGAAAALGSSAFGESQAPQQQSDDPFGAATQTDGHTLSPASSMKTRRAPPPAPVRSGTNSTTSTQMPPSNAAPATNSAFFGQGAAAQPQQTSFDDFEAAFNDLDPPHGNTAAANSGAQREATGTATGASASPDQFDDEFADADFDFVPSFIDSNSNGGQGGAQQQQTSDNSAAFPSTTTGNNDAFSGFDDAFGDVSAGPTATSTDSAHQAGATRGASSGTSSGFSFEDAFAPSSTATSGAAAAPSLPTRQTPATDDNTPTTNNNNTLSAPSTTEATGPRAPSPANIDDAPAVRQLAGMGFSRGKVIAALEKSNYKVNAALERLLADA